MNKKTHRAYNMEEIVTSLRNCRSKVSHINDESFQFCMESSALQELSFVRGALEYIAEESEE